jgi:hypothetical protein
LERMDESVYSLCQSVYDIIGQPPPNRLDLTRIKDLIQKINLILLPAKPAYPNTVMLTAPWRYRHGQKVDHRRRRSRR